MFTYGYLQWLIIVKRASILYYIVWLKYTKIKLNISNYRVIPFTKYSNAVKMTMTILIGGVII